MLTLNHAARMRKQNILTLRLRVQLLQQVPPVLYIVESGTVGFEALDHARAPCAFLILRIGEIASVEAYGLRNSSMASNFGA